MKIGIRISIVLFAIPVVAYLVYVGITSGVAIVAEPELSMSAMVKALAVHCLLPFAGVMVIGILAGATWWVTTLTGDLFDPNPNPTPQPIRPLPEPDRQRHELTATVITLREPNIDLSITLTGDAAKDSVGRKKIGAVMEHYGSGAAEEKKPAAEGGAV